MGLCGRCLAFGISLLVFSGVRLGAEITKGPYLQSVDVGAAVIMWETDAPGPSLVEYGETAALGSSEAIAAPVINHEVRLNGLRSNTEMWYRVTTGPDVSPIHSFTTQNPDATTLRFGVYGDTQAHPEIHQALVNLIAAADPDLVLFVGDHVYSGDLTEWNTLFFDPAASLMASVPYYPALGNHDVFIGTPWYDLFSPPIGSGTEQWYSFDYGDVHFIVLNTNADVTTGSIQHTWLEGDLIAAQDSAWTIVVQHHPAFSSGIYGPTPVVVDHLVPLYEAWGVDMVFSGHEHIYERSSKSGVVYVTSSGVWPRAGGQHVNPYSEVMIDWTYHCVVVEMTTEPHAVGADFSLTCTALDNLGAQIDQVTLSHTTVPAELTAFTVD